MPLLTLAAAPARAGSWAVTLSGSGSATAGPKAPQTMALPVAGTNTVSAPAVAKGGSGNANGPTSVTATAKATLSAHFAWQPTGASDTSPPSVMVYEQVTASALGQTNDATGAFVPIIGTVDDGLGDKLAPDANGQVAGHKYVTESGASFDVPLTINATVTATAGPNYTVNGAMGIGTCNATAGISAVTISIHAQPYNFHMTGVSLDTPNAGDLSFTYDWSSTDGQKGDLTTCYFHEYVTYPGGNPYTPPLSFKLVDQNGNSVGLKNPTVKPSSDTTSMAATTVLDTQYYWPSVAPYSAQPVTAPQQYQFNDSDTGQKNILIPGPDSTASIVRSLGQRSGYQGIWYSVTKQGTTDWVHVQ